MWIRLVPLVALLATLAPCQVSVKVSPTKSTYLVGEPVWVVVEVTNVGAEALTYTSCGEHGTVLAVEGFSPRQTPNLWGCSGVGGGVGGSYGCGIGQPPVLNPGAAVSYRSMLGNYYLTAGSFVLHAKGTAPVRWRSISDPVPGAGFNADVPITVTEGSDEELWKVYAPYLADADDAGNPGALAKARNVIVEMAPPLLEKTIYGFSRGSNADPSLAARGLGRIDTPASRADLISLYRDNANLALRRQIVQALAYMGTAEETTFFADVLQGLEARPDDGVRSWAALALGRIGTEDHAALEALLAAPAGAGAETRTAVAAALGNTKSPEAVPALIDMYSDQNENVRNTVCGTLRGLTAYQWCNGSGTDAAIQQERWRRWWATQASQIVLHGDGECPAWNARLPVVP
jgi:hypothetical protein